jgi:ribose transport system permease protein
MPTSMKKNMGIFLLLVLVFVITAIKNPNFLSAYNIQNTIRWTGLFGIIGIGVAFVIITGGIDLSIGSVIGLVASFVPWLIRDHGWTMGPAVLTGLLLSIVIGLLHGPLITKFRLQPFVVTLCGLLAYRSIARDFTNDNSQGYGTGAGILKRLEGGTIIESITGRHLAFDLPNIFIFMIVLAVIAAFFLNRTIWGRYLFALGRNEEAARFSGIRTQRLVMLTYVICSFLAGVGGIVFSLDANGANPSSFGAVYELYAIAAAVLGGCSLRGGEGSIVGVIIGTALMRVLYNANNILGGKTQREQLMVAVVILAAVTVDEVLRRLAAKRKRVIVQEPAPARAIPTPGA